MPSKFYTRKLGPFTGYYKKKVRFPTIVGGNKYSRGKYGKKSRKTNARGRYMGRKLNRRG